MSEEDQEYTEVLKQMQSTVLEQLIKLQSLPKSMEKDTIQQSLKKCSENLNSLILTSITGGIKNE